MSLATGLKGGEVTGLPIVTQKYFLGFETVSPDFHWQNTFATFARDLFCKNTWSQKCDNFPASFTDQE